MSTIPAPQPRSRPPSSTREQLDELDALLQRMLELPVDPAGVGAEPPEEPGYATEPPPPPPAAEAAPSVAPSPPEEPEPVAETPPPAPAEVEPAAPVPVAPRQDTAHSPATPAPRMPRPAIPPVERLPAWLGPVVLVNRLFDRATAPLGAAGSWLRRPRGRALLGWTGLLLLAAAGALAFLTWRGWF